VTTTPDTSREAIERLARDLREDRHLYVSTKIAGTLCNPLGPKAADALIALLERAEAAERERDEAREKCMGCLTDDEKTESINELAAALAAERERDEAQKDVSNLMADFGSKQDELNTALAALRTAEGALASVREAILDCRDRAMFSSKENVVKHVAERLPSINATLSEIRKAPGGKP
jgi:chromosome segregation ATPase